MDIGLMIPGFASDSHVFPPGQFKRLCRTIDARRYSGLWVTEHLVKPPSYRTSFLDPLATLSVAAGVTENISLGTGILILPMRDPVLVAKRAATIQHLAENRLTLGLGVGYVADEYDAVGVPYEERGPRYAEATELLWRLFTEDEVSFDGEFYRVENVRLEPKLRQPPRLLRGGGTLKRGDERRLPRSFKDSLGHLDGWLALPKRPADLADEWDVISAHLGERADGATFDKALFAYVHVVPDADSELAERKQRKAFGRLFSDEDRVNWALERNFTGSEDEIRDQLLAIRDLGFDEVILGPVAHSPTEYRRQVERLGDVCPFIG